MVPVAKLTSQYQTIKKLLRIISDVKDLQAESANQPKEIHLEGKQSATYHLNAGQAWYLIHCKPNGERMALRNLENQNFSAFLPLQKLTRRKGTVFETKLRPLFPGYMFVAQEPASGQWRKINSTRGVVRLISFAKEPTPVPSTIMDQLFARCDVMGVFQQNTKLVEGDEAKITQGPFAGAVAKIVEIDANLRVHLLLDVMGQKSKLTLDAEGVAPTA